jgi:7-cyano-7-deazaguanine synthase
MGGKVISGRAIVLLSGGMDSTIALYWAMQRFEVAAAMTFNYGQRHWVEVAQATKIARAANVEHIHETRWARLASA